MVVVKIMAPFWLVTIIRHPNLGDPKGDQNLTTTHMSLPLLQQSHGSMWRRVRMGVFLVLVLIMNAILLFGVYTRTPDFWKPPCSFEVFA